MARVRFSRRAEADLYGIGLHTLRTWGEAQTARYLGELEDCCRLVADNPGLGRPCGRIRPGLRRMEKGKHVVFYRLKPGAIRAVRVLHQRMPLSKSQFAQ